MIWASLSPTPWMAQLPHNVRCDIKNVSEPCEWEQHHILQQQQQQAVRRIARNLSRERTQLIIPGSVSKRAQLIIAENLTSWAPHNLIFGHYQIPWTILATCKKCQTSMGQLTSSRENWSQEPQALTLKVWSHKIETMANQYCGTDA